MKKLLCVLFLSSFSLSLFAGDATGKVDNILVRSSDGMIYFFLKDVQLNSPKPACATNSYWIIKDENSSTAKHQLSMLIAAQMAGKKVRVYGYNTCTRWADGEDVNLLQLYSY